MKITEEPMITNNGVEKEFGSPKKGSTIIAPPKIVTRVFFDIVKLYHKLDNHYYEFPLYFTGVFSKNL